MDSVLPLGQWLCSGPNITPPWSLAFLMLGLKRPQTVMEICLHSQILLHMEACVSHLCRRRAPAEQEGGAAIRPKHSWLCYPPGSQEQVCGATPLLCRDWVSLGAVALSTRQGEGPVGSAASLNKDSSSASCVGPGTGEWGCQGNPPTTQGSSPPRGASYPINCPV